MRLSSHYPLRVCSLRDCALPRPSFGRARGQEPPASQHGSQVAIYSIVQSSIREEQPDKDEHVDNCPSNVCRTSSIRTAEAFSRRPDDNGQEDSNNIREITESAKDQGNGYSGLSDGNRMSEDMGIHLHDVDPEINPCLDPDWLTIERASQVAHEIVDEVRLPLEPRIDGPDQSEDDT